MKGYNNTKTLSVIYIVYIIIFTVTCILMCTDWFPWQFNFLRYLFSFLCLFAYFPIAAIIYGSYSYIKTQEIAAPGLKYGLWYSVLGIIAFFAGAVARFDVLNASNWRERICLILFLSIDLLFLLRLLINVGLSFLSGFITHLIVSKIKAKK